VETIKKTGTFGDRSPDISPEEKQKHDLEAEKFKYKIALDELSFYINSSAQHAASRNNVARERTWTDHRGQVWVTENPISPTARNELRMVLGVIRDYESKYAERSHEKQALSDIANARTAGREQAPNRLAYFERQAAPSEPVKSIAGINTERIPEHGTEIER